MKQKKNIYRRLLTCCIIAAALASCCDQFDLNQLQNPSKLVVYCFPSDADTTYISVTNSVGVKKYADTHKIHNIASARVSYTVNGQPRPVSQQADGTFYVVGTHQPGDHVCISVEHPDYATVSAQTTVPEQVPVELKDVREVMEYDSYWLEMGHYYQLRATFTDPVASTDYYAVRVRVYGIVGDNHPMEFWPDIATIDEPQLQGLSDIDGDFGFENEYYQHFYIFNDQGINGQTYTMHLDIQAQHYSDNPEEPARYQVLLYKIAPEYYRFLKSINEVENNELARSGFAQLMPTYTNIRQGAGVLGGYWWQASNWCELTEEK